MGERRSLLDTDRQDRLHIDATGHRAVTAALQHSLKEEDGPHAIPHVGLRSVAGSSLWGKVSPATRHSISELLRITLSNNSESKFGYQMSTANIE